MAMRRFPYFSLALLGLVCYIYSPMILTDGAWMLIPMMLGGILIGILLGAIVGAVIGAVVGELRAEEQTIASAMGGAAIGALFLGFSLGACSYGVSMMILVDKFISATHEFSWRKLLFFVSWPAAPVVIPILLSTIITSMERRGYNRNIVVTSLLLTVGLGMSLGLL